MSIIRALLYPNVFIHTNRGSHDRPIGVWSVTVRAMGHEARVSLRDVQLYCIFPMIDGLRKVSKFKFRGYELTFWKPGKKVSGE